MDEFDLIRTHFAPLAGDGAFSLTDDVALTDGGVISKDVLVSGVHFRPDDPLDLVARKALRVNISDIVAKGATPTGYMLGITWPNEVGGREVELFCKGLAADQKEYGLALLGGDTTRHRMAKGPLMISVTMIGMPCEGPPVLRSGARLADVVMVTGCIGDAGLGLAALQENPSAEGETVNAYQLPQPPAEFARTIAQYATASLDVSDGLLADAQHLAAASGVSVELFAQHVPLSVAGTMSVQDGGEAALLRLLTAGDDYQSIFTVRPDQTEQVKAAAIAAGVPVTEVGQCREGAPKLRLLGSDGAEIAFGQAGYSHF